MKLSRIAAVILCAGVVFAAAFSSKADLTFGLGTVYSGTTPQGSAPWLTIDITDFSPNTVEIKLTASGITGSEAIDGAYLNFDPTLNSSLLTIVKTNGGTGNVGVTGISTGNNSANGVGGGGLYDIKFNFQNANNDDGRFTAGESVIFLVTGIPGLNAAMFNYLSSPQGGNGTWYAAAHVISIPVPGSVDSVSGWIGDGDGSPTPEPATMAILGAFIAIGVYLKRRQAPKPAYARVRK